MDYIRPTPQQNPLLGLLAERLKQAQGFAAKPFGYSNPPVEMLMSLLGIPAVQQTMERMAYGEPLTTGQGMTTQVRPEVAEAALTVAPAAGLLAKATKGLPVGMSIKNLDELEKKYPDVIIDAFVSKDDINLSRIVVPKEMRSQGIGTQVMNDLSDYADSIGKRITLTPSSDFGGSVPKLKSFYKEFGFVENKGKNKDFSTRETMYREPQPIDAPSTYPQQSALDTAQKNAALPISEGGLGLPPNNTPMDRAMAMGFEQEVYHGTQRAPEGIANFGGQVGYAGQTGSQANWFTTDPNRASLYANVIKGAGNPTVYPVITRSGKQLSDEELSKLISKLNLDQNLEISLYDKKLQRELKKQGIQDLEWMPGQGEEKYKVIFDPSQIRSTNAAFDPMRRNESDILAGLLPASLLADPETRRKLDEELSLLYTK
jgi:GNAT superfamily N-acetyltransferase